MEKNQRIVENKNIIVPYAIEMYKMILLIGLRFQIDI